MKGGGHNVTGTAVCDDGLVIDLSPMDSVRVDPNAMTARVQAGATIADLDHETQAFGLAVPAGIVSETGVAGLTLGGGTGRLARKHGLTIDNLRSVDLVTAEGKLVHASESENPDLFWGVRGVGGNFGVVTSFEYDCHEVGSEVLGGRIVHPFDDARAVLRSYRAFVTDAPEAVNCLAGIATAPANSALPESIRGERIVQLTVCYAGAIEEGREVLRPLRSVGEPIADLVRPQPYTRVQRILTEAAAEGYRNYWKSDYLAGLPDEAIDVVLEYCERFPSPSSSVFFETMGGAINRADVAATAFPHRDAAFSVTAWARWTDSTTDDEHVESAREFLDAMTPYSTDGVYVNFLGREGTERVEAAYGDNYDRLAALKTEWDPGNLFRMNQNVEPTA